MSLVESAGCASKIDEATLKRVLRGLPFLDDPRVLVGAPAGDDAGVYRLDDELALVQTVDVFTPSVDDPYMFGQIAAANSLSDVYAMGGRPITALSIVGFPIRTVPDDVMHQILRGGMDKMAEAGVAVIGGHSINDKEIKAGFAVTGLVHPDKIVTNAGARPGDRLILTKPLGTGIMAFAAQIGRAPAGGPEAAARSMATLNDAASKLMIECGAHACTDVTGFGLMGHLAAMAAASKVDVEIVWDDLPLLPGVLAMSGRGNRFRRGGAEPGIVGPLPDRGRECAARHAGHLLRPADFRRAADCGCRKPRRANCWQRLHAAGIAEAAIIGKVLDAGSGRVLLRSDGRRQLPARRPTPQAPAASTAQDASVKERTTKQETSNMSCCEGNHGSEHNATSETGGAAATRAKIPGVFAGCRRTGRVGREDQAGHCHCTVRLGPMRAVREKPREKGPGDGFRRRRSTRPPGWALLSADRPRWRFTIQ